MDAIKTEHRHQDQMRLVKILEYIDFCVYDGLLLLKWSFVIILLQLRIILEKYLR